MIFTINVNVGKENANIQMLFRKQLFLCTCILVVKM